MVAFAIAALLVPLVDHAVKRLVIASIGSHRVPLAPVGELRIVRARIWLNRRPCAPSAGAMWGLWATAAAGAVAVAAVNPASGWPLGLLVGGAFSHAFETTVHGTVCDYICLRAWPAFDLADVALTVGMLGVALDLLEAAG